MKDSYRIAVLIFTGCLTMIMSAFTPVAGGGASLVLVLSIPFFITLAIVFALIYRAIARKTQEADIKRLAYYLMVFFILTFSVLAYPFKNSYIYGV